MNKTKTIILIFLLILMSGCTNRNDGFYDPNINKENAGKIVSFNDNYYFTYADSTGLGIFRKKAGKPQKLVDTRLPAKDLNLHNNMLYYVDCDETKQFFIYQFDFKKQEKTPLIKVRHSCRKIKIVEDNLYYLEATTLHMLELKTGERHTFDLFVQSSYDVCGSYIYYNQYDVQKHKYWIKRFDCSTGMDEILHESCSDMLYICSDELYFIEQDIFKFEKASNALYKIDQNNKKIKLTDVPVTTYSILGENIYFKTSEGVFEQNISNVSVCKKISDEDVMYMYAFNDKMVFMTPDVFLAYNPETKKTKEIAQLSETGDGLR